MHRWYAIKMKIFLFTAEVYRESDRSAMLDCLNYI